jgi:hypothetical protein
MTPIKNLVDSVPSHSFIPMNVQQKTSPFSLHTIALANNTNADELTPLEKALEKVIHIGAIAIIVVATLFLFKTKLILGAIALIPAGLIINNLSKIFFSEVTPDQETIGAVLNEDALKKNPIYGELCLRIILASTRRTDCQTEDDVNKLVQDWCPTEPVKGPIQWGTLKDGRAYALLSYKLMKTDRTYGINEHDSGVCPVIMEKATADSPWKLGKVSPRFGAFWQRMKNEAIYRPLSEGELIRKMISKTYDRGFSRYYGGGFATEFSYGRGSDENPLTHMILCE